MRLTALVMLLLFCWAPVAQAQTPVERSCDNGDAQACNNWGYDLEHGHGVERDMTRALKVYRRACDMGEPFSCTNAGLFVNDARMGGTPDPVAALPLLVQGCDGGDPKGCAWAARLHREVDGVKDLAVSARFVQRGCDMGDANACIWLGIYLEDGTGLAQDRAAAMQGYRKACDLGAGMGCYNGALLLKSKDAVDLGEQRFVQSVEMAQEGCDLDNLNACNTLGYALDAGRGVPRDRARARALFARTCAEDSGLGCSNLSRMMINGDGGPRDRVKGRALRTKACTLGYRRAC